ncbi:MULTISPECIES: hypothetical protein [Pseudomonas]|uniref:hypothetical protein n=1 Tax=Pseudomonas TaxID=286 RepID=UPI0013DFD29D|nr:MULTISPECIES: hypothetical protein [Pseudomonas]MCE0912021.1 hypothetical protein [Pseudomonas kurunegalensis]QIG17812.1 hypothetical protein FY041_08565 [Pseudomonas monteilii]QIG23069.1 hypothetical protein FY043_08560 [Pseudomonas monteilii]WJR57557.1 hypothetical protein LU664_008370 [Pseudomonas kurunegalensis]
MNQSIDLEAAKAAFFASGGQIIVLEGFQYVPFRQRHHPEPKPKLVTPVKQERSGERKSRAKARTAQVEELAKTMTCGEVAKLLGETKTALWGVAARGGFRFFSPPKPARPEKVKAEPSQEDRDLADKIIALRDSGMSRWGVTLELGIGNCRFARILAAFDIDFPLQRNRG